MSDILQLSFVAALLTVSANLIRVFGGPTFAGQMIGAQLAGTGGAALLVLAIGSRTRPAVDVALVLTLLAAFAAVGFTDAATSDGVGDQEEEAQWWMPRSS